MALETDTDPRPGPQTAPARRALAGSWRWLAGGAAVLLVAGLAWALWPAGERQAPAAGRLDYTACLLTDGAGTGGGDAAPVWAGMQDAARTAGAKVRSVAIEGEQSVNNAKTSVAQLAQSTCDVILAAGKIPAAGVEVAAPTFPVQRFVVVGGKGGANVATVDGSPAQVQAGVRKLIVDAMTIPPPQR